MTVIEIAILVAVCAGSIGSMIILINATDFPSTTETLKERQIQAEFKPIRMRYADWLTDFAGLKTRWELRKERSNGKRTNQLI